jgi:hypothetical protein
LYTLSNTAVTSSPDVAANSRGSTGSADFGGAAMMQTLANLNLSTYTNLTIEWFMKTSQTSPALVWEHSPSGNAGPGGMSGIVNDLAPAPSIEVLRFTPGGSPNAYDIVTNSIPTTGWHHYAAEIDKNVAGGASIKFYLDSVLAGGVYWTATNSTPGFLNNIFYLGARNGLVAPFVGKLDEFRISDTLLAPADFIPNATPEPAALSLLALGLAMCRLYRRIGHR